MARGESGRIVLEIDPVQKQELYAAVTRDGMTLKEWFLRRAAAYLRDRGQLEVLSAAGLAESPVPYRVAAAGEDGRQDKTKGKRTAR